MFIWQDLYFAIRKSGNYLFVESLCILTEILFSDKRKKITREVFKVLVLS